MANQENHSPAASATALADAAEALELDAAWSAPVAEAKASNAGLRAVAIARIYPAEIAPAPSDAWAALSRYEARLPRLGYGVALLQLHARALASFPALAQLIRSPECRADVGAAAATQAVVLARPAHELAEEAITAFDRELAAQLVHAGHELAPAARDLLLAAELERRVDAAKARHAEHAAAVLRHAEEERRAAEEARAEELARDANAAAEEARRLDLEAAAARENARRLAGEELARKIRASRLTDLIVAGRLYDAEQVAATAPRMTLESIASYSAALAAAKAAA